VKGIAANLVRVCVVGVVFGLVGVAAIYTAWRFCYPYAEEWRARAEVAQLEHRVASLRGEHQRLQQQARLLATPEGIKIEARRLGLLKPGERSLRFMTRPEPREALGQTPPEASGARGGTRIPERGASRGANRPAVRDGAAPPASRSRASEPTPDD